MQNNPRQLCLQMQSTVDYLRSLAFEAQVYGHLWRANEMVGGGSCSSEVRDFHNLLLGKKNNSTEIFSRILTQANLALARINQTPIQNVGAIRNGYDLAQTLRVTVMSLEVTLFQIRATLPVEDIDDVVNIYSNKKP